jgi:APA family basic amino acid/polyamine antiporter
MTSARPLGLWSATALVVGNMIGSGVFLLPASLAQYGSASVLGWALSIAGALLLAVVFARLGQRYPVCGGPYAFSRLAFGDFVGFLMAWSYWISVWCSVAAIAVAFAGAMTSLAPQWFSTPARSAACSIGVLWLCTVLNLAGMRTAGIAQVVLTVLKLLPLVAVIALGARFIDPHAYTPFNPSGDGLLSVTTTTAALALWALLGMECATIPADHVADAERTVPRATILGVAVGAVVSVAVCMICIGLVPIESLKISPAPFADAAQRFAGPAASVVMAAAMAVSCLGALNGWILVQGQIPLAAARDQLFPAVFARIDGNDTPRVGLVIGSVLATVLVVSNFDNSLVGIFTASILLATAAALLPYLVCAAALWRLEPRAPDARTWRRVAAVLAVVFSAWALVGTGAQALVWGAGLLLAGLPVYALMRWRR